MLPIGIALPVMQIFSITLTANHFFLDAAAGAVVGLLGFPVAIALHRWGYPWLGRLLRRVPLPALRRLLAAPEEAKGDSKTELASGP